MQVEVLLFIFLFVNILKKFSHEKTKSYNHQFCNPIFDWFWYEIANFFKIESKIYFNTRYFSENQVLIEKIST